MINRTSQSHRARSARNRTTRYGLMLAALAGVSAAPLLAHAAADGGASASTVSEVVVTAGKREEKLTNVPSSITAVRSEQIQLLGISKVDDYVGLVPNLSQVSAGAPGNSNIIIRGVYTGSSSLTATTAYYLDDTPITASATDSVATYISPDVDLVDIDRVEVLKGPQATLYGANALGGVLRIISKKPDTHDFSGAARTELSSVNGGGTGYAINGSVNIPLVHDQLAVRINAFDRQDPGYYDNLGTGHRDVNQADIYGVRAAVRWQASDRLTVDVSGLYQKIKADSLGVEYDTPGTLTPAFARYAYNSRVDLPARTTYANIDAALTYRTDIGTLTATAAYADYKTFLNSDTSALFAPFLGFLGATPGALANETIFVKSRKQTDEIRFASNRLGSFEFLVGGFYTHEDDFFHTNVSVVNPNGSIPPGFGGLLIDSPNAITYKEIAAYGDLTYYLTDSLDITGGARYSKNKQFIDSKTFGFYSLFFPTATYGFDDSSVNYLATLRWRPNADTNFYIRAANGYRPGGPNIGATSYGPFKSDTLNNYEVGVKGTLFDRHLQYSLSAYRLEWKDVQLPGVDPISGSQITTNGGAARVNGAELEITARPVERLSLTGALGYNDAKLTAVDPGTAAVIGAAPGDRLPGTPKVTLSLIADYTQPLNDRVTADFGANYRALGDRYSSFPGSFSNPNVVLPSYGVLNIWAGVTLDARYTLTARVQNIGDSHGVQSSNTSQLFPGQPGVYAQTIRVQPRTFVLSLAAKF